MMILQIILNFFSDFLKIIPFSDYNFYFIFMGNKEFGSLLNAAQQNNFYHGGILVWVKNQFVIGRADYNSQHELILFGWFNHHKFYGGHNHSTVLNYDKPRMNDLHPTMKPIELLTKLIMDGSRENMLVYDPFLGSGSTLIACEQTNRICYGMEIDPAYIDVIIERWENFTGKKANLIQH